MEQSAQGPPNGGERRIAPRHNSNQRITCYPAGGGLSERRQARVRNVSRTGIGLAVDRPWPPGTMIIVELPLAEEGIKAVKAKVVHSTALLGGNFLVGCNFESSINDVDIQVLTC